MPNAPLTLKEKVEKLEQDAAVSSPVAPTPSDRGISDVISLDTEAMVIAHNMLHTIASAAANSGGGSLDERDALPGAVSRFVDHTDPIMVYSVLTSLLGLITNMSYNQEFIMLQLLDSIKNKTISSATLPTILFNAMTKGD